MPPLEALHESMKTLAALACSLLPALGGGATFEDEPERLTEWPQVERSRLAQVKKDVARLRKAHTEEMGRQAAEGLGDVGDAAAPFLLAALGKEKDKEARGRVLDILTEITGAQHTRLLAQEFDHKSEHVRRFAFERAACFPDAGIRKAAEKALAATRKRLKKGDGSKKEAYLAALAVTSSGSLEGLEEVLERAAEKWPTDGAEIRVAAESVRGDEATQQVLADFDEGRRKDAIARLNLLAGCGTEKALPLLKPLLDSSDQGIRLAVVNALRGIVDGEPPLDRLSVFQTIEKVEEWKKKLP